MRPTKRRNWTRRIGRGLVVLACAASMNWIVAWGLEWNGRAPAPAATPAPPGLNATGVLVWDQLSESAALKSERPWRELPAIWPAPVADNWPAVPHFVIAYVNGGLAEITAHASSDHGEGVDSWTQEVRELGWPWRSVWSGELLVRSRKLAEVVVGSPGTLVLPPGVGNTLGLDRLPFGVRPAAFAANTLVYAGVLTLPAVVWGAARAWRRRRRGLCAACAYPIGVAPVCSECGEAVTPR